MLKKVISFLMSVTLCITMLPCGYAFENVYNGGRGENVSEKYHVFSESELQDSYGSTDIIVLTEEQMLTQGDAIKDILETAKMVYIPTQCSEQEVIDATGIEPLC